MSGKFIVIYGSNNIGKSTQAEILANSISNCVQLKYPIYDLKPTGALLNQILRYPEMLTKTYTEREIQEIYVQNRADYEPVLKKLLTKGRNVLAEDYIGTGIAWGLTRGLSLVDCEKLNEGLLVPDISILLDAEYRYVDAIEKNHKNENDQELWIKNRNIYRRLAEYFGWEVVNANQLPEVVTRNIFDKINLLH